MYIPRGSYFYFSFNFYMDTVICLNYGIITTYKVKFTHLIIAIYLLHILNLNVSTNKEMGEGL